MGHQCPICREKGETLYTTAQVPVAPILYDMDNWAFPTCGTLMDHTDSGLAINNVTHVIHFIHAVSFIIMLVIVLEDVLFS